MPPYDIPSQSFPIEDGPFSEKAGHITFGINAEPDKFNTGTTDMWPRTITVAPNPKVAFIRPEYSSTYLQQNI